MGNGNASTSSATPYGNKTDLKKLAIRLSVRGGYFGHFYYLTENLRRRKALNDDYRAWNKEARALFVNAVVGAYWCLESVYGAIPRTDEHMRTAVAAVATMMGYGGPMPSARTVRRWTANWPTSL